jgi:putative resolvase
MRLRFRYRLDPQGRNLVMVDPGATTDDQVGDMIKRLTSCCARLHGRGGARNRALRAVTWAKQPPGAGPAGSGGQDD